LQNAVQAAHLGRRNYFLASITVFTIASGLCGMAGSLGQLILFRVIQGLAGGGLQPSSQSVLLDAFPPEKQGAAMTRLGFAALIAPIVGPTLGGWLTDSYSWRWVFLINVPVGLLAFVGCYALLRDPDYLTKQRSELKKQPFHFDSIGLSLLVIVMVSWEVMLSKGQEWDWFGDPVWRVQTLASLFAVGLIALVFWDLRHRNPVREGPADLRPPILKTYLDRYAREVQRFFPVPKGSPVAAFNDLAARYPVLELRALGHAAAPSATGSK